MIDADEVAKMLGISRSAVYDLAAPKGPIPCARFGRRMIRFNVEDIEAFKQRHMQSWVFRANVTSDSGIVTSHSIST